MSRETTFERDLHAVRDKAELSGIFTDLCMRLAQDLQRKGYVARTIGIKLRYDDFKIATRDQTGPQYTADGATIRQWAGQCLKRVPLDKRLRLLGVRASTLARQGQELVEPASMRAIIGAQPSEDSRLDPMRPRDDNMGDGARSGQLF